MGITMLGGGRKSHSTLLLAIFIFWMIVVVFLLAVLIVITMDAPSKMIGVYILTDMVCMSLPIFITIAPIFTLTQVSEW